jgi:hypothetical protein
MINIRRWHSYIGLFMGPGVLFFALTGAAQIFNLHEAHGSYQPPAILEKLSSVHKDQVFALGHHPEPTESEANREQPVGVNAPATVAEDDSDKPGRSTLLLKIFFLMLALCLVLSTTLGLWIGLTQTRPKRVAWLLVFAGTLIPVGLLLL